MKKRYLALTAVGLILGFVAKAEHWLEDERELYFPVTKEQLREYAKHSNFQRSVSQANNTSSEQTPDLSKLSQSLLTDQLYINKVLNQTVKQAEFFSMIKNRFNIEYTDNNTEKKFYKKEVQNRLTLLKAMSDFWSPEKEFKYIDTDRLKLFFSSTAANHNENILVRRQAYLNLLKFKSHNVDKAKLAENNKRIQLVSFSDEAMIDSLVSSD